MMTRSFAEDKRIVDTKLKGSYSIFCECTVVSPFVLQYRQRIHLHKVFVARRSFFGVFQRVRVPFAQPPIDIFGSI